LGVLSIRLVEGCLNNHPIAPRIILSVTPSTHTGPWRLPLWLPLPWLPPLGCRWPLWLPLYCGRRCPYCRCCGCCTPGLPLYRRRIAAVGALAPVLGQLLVLMVVLLFVLVLLLLVLLLLQRLPLHRCRCCCCCC
jgi:hypothetical protein